MGLSLEQIPLAEQVAEVLAEDIGTGDLTAALIPESTQAEATVICREPGILCGRPWFDEVFHQLDAGIRIDWSAAEGEAIAAEQLLCTLRGPARAILSGERAALNFLQTLSGTAAATARYVAAVAGTGVAILDTRKTLPGLRLAQKYAVAQGGGRNHRIGLYDMVLIKENHILAAGSIAAAVATARNSVAADIQVEVEVENLDEVREALEARADILLLDNMDNATLSQAVAMNTEFGGHAKLEASGGVSLESVRAIAETGVDYISVGALTKDVKALDLSMRFQPGS